MALFTLIYFGAYLLIGLVGSLLSRLVHATGGALNPDMVCKTLRVQTLSVVRTCLLKRVDPTRAGVQSRPHLRPTAPLRS